MTESRYRVSFVLFDLGYRGGIVRTVVNLANHLAQHHDVEIISVIRQREAPVYPVADGVTIRYLEDRREQVRLGRLRNRARAKLPSRMFHPNDDVYRRASLLTDLTLCRALRSLPAGLLVTTRPSLHMIAARVAPDRVRVIGQEHINFKTRSKHLRQAFLDVADGLDALAVLTERDKQDYEKVFNGKPTVIEAIPNALSWPRGEPAPLQNKIVLAAGRLARQKGFDLLIDAYEPVARAHPDWQLHIYGAGGEHGALRRQITDLSLEGSVVLKGRTERMAEAMSGASVFALSSRFEGFPMVLLEAMSVGLPVVSFDCPRGPREVVSTGHNGYLVDNGDVEGFSQGLLAMVEDAEGRRRMGAGAFEAAQAYEMEAICRRWQDLFDQLMHRERTQRRAQVAWRKTRDHLPLAGRGQGARSERGPLRTAER